MKIVDLRSNFTSKNDVLIEIAGTHIYYAEEKMIEGERHLFLFDYDRSTRRERTLSDYFVEKPGFVMHYFPFADEILMVMEDGGSEAWLLRLDKSDGQNQKVAQVRFAGSYADCCALDANHVVLYSTENPRDATLFREYKRQTGFTAPHAFAALRRANAGPYRTRACAAGPGFCRIRAAASRSFWFCSRAAPKRRSARLTATGAGFRAL